MFIHMTCYVVSHLDTLVTVTVPQRVRKRFLKFKGNFTYMYLLRPHHKADLHKVHTNGLYMSRNFF